ncbi:MAG: PspC domain-containing protein [Firmicutes bacterium]|nr:PspC domain-containing protein [Dethiobacter sp.]MBS3888167.1 PspC domain-containing protein [Bacillota bacterium]MBS4054353.1 PspC domain-containing protein [Thermaerobacter sp.]
MERRLYRSLSNRMIGGICGGLAEYVNADPTIIRLLMLLFVLFGGAGFLFYLAAWVIIPERSSSA